MIFVYCSRKVRRKANAHTTSVIKSIANMSVQLVPPSVEVHAMSEKIIKPILDASLSERYFVAGGQVVVAMATDAAAKTNPANPRKNGIASMRASIAMPKEIVADWIASEAPLLI